MPRKSLRYGCLVVVSLACCAGVAAADEPLRVQSRVFDVDYAVNESALPLASVSLWFTADRGLTWQKFAEDEDRQPPISFHAPQDGLFGLYLIAGNATGPSSVLPTSKTKPHLWVFVDETPPVVQLHELRQVTVLGRRVVQIRWTAIDAHFGPRPVEIHYRRGPDDSWHSMTPEPLANTGRFDWRVRDELVGPIAVRLAVVDRGGHRVSSERRTLEVARVSPLLPGQVPAPLVDRRTRVLRAAQTSASPVGNNAVRPGSIRANERASRLYREAMTHRERGEYAEGVSRLREAIKLKPQWSDAFAQMAQMLYRLGDLDRSRDAYEVALQQQPGMRDALRGLAMVDRRNQDYASAARSLRTILRYDPKDVEVWMNLGDIAIYQGDDILARECYLRAAQMDTSATRVVADARQRLELMSDVSRRYRSGSE